MEELSRDNIEKAAKGDIEAFEAIYRATSGFVYNTALRIINNTADAQEITQDIFLKIYDSLKDFEYRSSFKTWVYRITVNFAINAYRKKKKELGRKGDFDTAIETEGHSAEVIPAAEKADAEKLLYSLLEKLSPEHRAVIVLREIEGLSYEDIAESLRINLNTVRSRLKRAREALMEYSKKAVKDGV
jgi:RNA polymerase sigma-70 factor, ECF subfamily